MEFLHPPWLPLLQFCIQQHSVSRAVSRAFPRGWFRCPILRERPARKRRGPTKKGTAHENLHHTQPRYRSCIRRPSWRNDCPHARAERHAEWAERRADQHAEKRPATSSLVGPTPDLRQNRNPCLRKAELLQGYGQDRPEQLQRIGEVRDRRLEWSSSEEEIARDRFFRMLEA